MKAPEKLYFDKRDKGILDIYSNKESNDDIEYTRTDALIEKVCGFLREHGDLVNYEIFDPDSRTYVMDYEKLIDDFKNYMKGESK